MAGTLPARIPCPSDGDVSALAASYREAVIGHATPIVQRCRECERRCFPPMLRCARCHSDDLEWEPVSPRGMVGTFVTVHSADGSPSMSVPGRLRESVPYSTVFVTPHQINEVRLPAVMIGDQLASLCVGSDVVFRVNGSGVLECDLVGDVPAG